jgi:hypothetical protein
MENLAKRLIESYKGNVLNLVTWSLMCLFQKIALKRLKLELNKLRAGGKGQIQEKNGHPL